MRTFWSPIALLLLAACSFDWDVLDPRLASATSGVGGAGGSAGGGTGGVAAMGGGGDGGAPLGEWGAPQLIDSLVSTGHDDDPSFTDDLLELYFNSGRTGTDDVWVSVRDAVSDDWLNPQRVAELSTPALDTDPVVSGDGLTMYLTSDRDGTDRIYIATRNARNDPWGVPAVVDSLASAFSVHWIADDHLTLAVNLGGDLGLATRPDPMSAWSLTAIDELNSPVDDNSLMLSDDLLSAMIDSERNGTLDLYTTERASTDEPWAPAVPVLTMSSVDDESDPFISPDRRYMVLARGKSGSPAGIYEARR